MRRRYLGRRQSLRRSGTEFGGNVQSNTVQPKQDQALRASEKLRLGYVTQSDERADAALDDGDSFRGFDSRRLDEIQLEEAESLRRQVP